MEFIALVFSSILLGAYGAFPDAPQVKVDSEVLQRFGVFSDVNQPGYFNRIISIEPSWTSSNPTVKALAAQASAMAAQMGNDFMSLPAIDICRRLIATYRPLKEGPLMEFVVAHTLNAYQRVFDIDTNLNMNAMTQFSKMRGSSPDVAHLLCENNEEVLVAAIQLTRNAEPKSACASFTAMVSQNTSIIPSIISDAAASHGALHQLNHMLTNDEFSPVSNAVAFLRSNPVFPKLFQPLFTRRVIKEFSDYAAFYNQIENSEQIAHVIGMPVSAAKNIAFQKFVEFTQTNGLL